MSYVSPEEKTHAVHGARQVYMPEVNFLILKAFLSGIQRNPGSNHACVINTKWSTCAAKTKDALSENSEEKCGTLDGDSGLDR